MKSLSKMLAGRMIVLLIMGAFGGGGCGQQDDSNNGELTHDELVKNTFALDANQKLVAAIEEHGCSLDPQESFTNKLPWGGYAYMGAGSCQEAGKYVSLITYLSESGAPYATIASVKYLTPPAPGTSGKTTTAMSIIRVDEEGNLTETPWSDDDYSALFAKIAEVLPDAAAAAEESKANQANDIDESVSAARAMLGSPNLGGTAACETCDNFLPALNATDQNGNPVVINGGSTNCNKDCCSCQSDADVCAGYYASADRGVKNSIKAVKLVQGTVDVLGVVGDIGAVLGIVSSGVSAGISAAGGFLWKKMVGKVKSFVKEYIIVGLLAEAGIVIEFYYSKVHWFYELFKGPCGFESACLEIDDCNVEPECSVRATLPDGSTDWANSGFTRASDYRGLSDLAIAGKTCGIVDVVECFAYDENGKPHAPENCPPGAKARYEQTNHARWDSEPSLITYAQGMIPYHCPTGECTIVDSGTCHFGCSETSWTFNSRAEAEAALSCAHIGPIPFSY